MATIRDLLGDAEKIDRLARISFEMVDTDQSGYIDRNELEAKMTAVGLEMDFDGASKEDVDEIIKDLDTDQDGRSG
jgi:Ca2+-binding EF-hand superfamily protein